MDVIDRTEKLSIFLNANTFSVAVFEGRKTKVASKYPNEVYGFSLSDFLLSRMMKYLFLCILKL